MKLLVILLVIGLATLTSCDKDDGNANDHGHSHGHGHSHSHGHSHGHGHSHSHGEGGHVHAESPNAHPEGHKTAVEGPNGGELKDISSIGKLEYILDEKKGTMTVHILATDAKSPVQVSKAPEVIAIVDKQRVSADFKAEKMPSSTFTLTHDIFKKHIDVNVRVYLEGSKEPFLIPIPHQAH